MLPGISNFIAGVSVVPGTVTFSTPGTTFWTPPPLFNTMTIEIWGGGGSGGSSFSGGSTGGGGQGGYYSRWSIPAGSLSVTEQVIVGSGGVHSGFPAAPGGYSVFGQYAWARGGYGGYGALYGQQASAIYTPPTTRSFSQTYAETGGDGGLQGTQSGTYDGASTIYAGAGGAAEMNDPGNHGGPYTTYGGISSIGGGNGGGQSYGSYCNPGTPPGGGGAANYGGIQANGANGRIIISWS